MMRPVRKEDNICKGFTFAVALLFFLLSTYCASAQALLQTGREAPGFSLKDLGGSTVTLSQFSHKKATVILFWSTWSSNSGKALKRLQAFYDKYADKGIQILAINVENQHISADDEAAIKKFVSELKITFPVLLDKGLSTFHDYRIIAIPSTIVVSEGRISYELPGLPLVQTEEMFDYLRDLAGEASHSKIKPAYSPDHQAIADTNLGRKFVMKKMYAMAYPFFRKAIEKDPGYMLPYVEMAKLFAAEGKDAEAEETFRKALSMNPGQVAVLSEFGYLLTKTGRTKEALQILEKAVKPGSYTPSHYYYAYALGKNGQIKEAIKAFATAIELNPYDPTAYKLRGETYENDGKLKEAAADYQKALELQLKIRGQSFGG